MSNLSCIPLAELLTDRAETVTDIKLCEFAIRHGIESYGGKGHDEKSVQERLDANRRILSAINDELKERGMNIIDLPPAAQEGGLSS